MIKKILKNLLKIIIIAFVVIMSLRLIYVEYVFYLIPYNPIEDYYDDVPIYNIYYSFEDENSIEYSYSYSTKRENTKCNNEIIFDYFKDLELIPLTNKKYMKQIVPTIENGDRIEYMFSFKIKDGINYKTLHVNHIFLDNLSVIRITSDIPSFNDGYYRIIDDEFDYDYVNKLIKGELD